ncbi:L-seryl-tRNA(Sec) selenium transferase [Bacteroidota bacterium]
MKKELRKIPAVDKILNQKQIKLLIKTYGDELIKYCIRKTLNELRNDIKGKTAKEIRMDDIIGRVENSVISIAEPSLKPVINATGIILHTNLGRAPLGESVLDAIKPIVTGYSNLEFNLESAKRGHRKEHVTELIKFLTKAEDALVVNNNAAGVLLTLKALASRSEVVISRGELIEIGGSFRIPEIMKASGAKMVEVGTTNRTRITDYKKAITDKTAIIFKAHKSNYYIGGFSEEVELSKLSELAKKHNLLLVYDIGSGLLRKPKGLPLKDEPDVRSSLKQGVDLITFSCDKLLGGPQAGIVAGKKDLINKLNDNPMMRALRVDKLTIAALSASLKSYLKEEDLLKDIPAFTMLNRSKKVLEKLAQDLFTEFAKKGIESKIVESKARCGGGTLPHLEIDSFAVMLIQASKDKKFAEKIYHKLLTLDKPILAILREGNLFFDSLSLSENEIPYIAKAVKEIL